MRQLMARMLRPYENRVATTGCHSSREEPEARQREWRAAGDRGVLVVASGARGLQEGALAAVAGPAADLGDESSPVGAVARLSTVAAKPIYV